MPVRSGRRSRVSLIEYGQTEAYVFPLSGAEDVGSDQDLIDVPLYRGTAEMMDKLLGLKTAGGRLPVNLDTKFFPRFVSLQLGRGKYSVVASGSGYRHHWGLDAALACHLQKDSLETPPETFMVKNCKPGGYQMTGAVAGPATYNPNFMGTGEEDSTQVDATPTSDPFVPLSNLNGRIALNGVALDAQVTEFTQEYNADLQSTDTYFSDLKGGIVEGDPTDGGQLTIIYSARADYYDLAASNARPSLDCIYANKKMENGPTEWVRFIRPAVTLAKGMPRMGGKNQLVCRQRFGTVPYDVAGLKGSSGEVFSIPGPFNITATDVTLTFKIDGGADITKTLTVGSARTAAQIVTEIGSFTGGVAYAIGNRVFIVSNTKGASSSVTIVDAGANSAHDKLQFTGVVGTPVTGIASEFVIEVLNSVASYATW